MLHTGISGSDLFSQGAVHIPTRLRMKPPLPIVSVVTWGISQITSNKQMTDEMEFLVYENMNLSLTPP